MSDIKTTEQIIDECLLLRSRTHPDLMHRLAFVMTGEELQAVTVDLSCRGAFTVSSYGEPYLAGVPIMVSRSRKRGPERAE
jgi:hypothetical protein